MLVDELFQALGGVMRGAGIVVHRTALRASASAPRTGLTTTRTGDMEAVGHSSSNVKNLSRKTDAWWKTPPAVATRTQRGWGPQSRPISSSANPASSMAAS